MFLLLFSPAVLSAQADADIDSLIGFSSGKEKLLMLQDAVLRYAGTGKAQPYLSMFEEARLQGNADFMSVALMLAATHYGNSSHTDSFFHYARRSSDYSLVHGFHDRYFAVESYIVQRHIYEGSYETALACARRMLAKAQELQSAYGEINAYECIGLAYLAAGQPAEAIGPLEEGFALLERSLPDNFIYQQEYALNIMSAALESGNYEKALEYCDKARVALENFHVFKQGTEWENFTLAGSMLQMESSYAACYMRTGRMDEARAALQRAGAYLEMEVEDVYIFSFDLISAEYHNLAGNNALALEYLDKAQAFAVEYGIHDYLRCLELRAKIYADTGDYRNAYLLKSDAAAKRDSLATGNFTRQVNELRTIYEMDKITAEKERTKILLLWALFAALMLAMILTVWIIYSRRLHIKNKGLVKLIREQDRIKEEQREQRIAASEPVAPGRPASSEAMLFNRLEAYLLETGAYLDSGFDRQKLPAELGTNTTYIYNAVKAVTGQTLQEYINSLRLDAAKRMLEEVGELTVEAIALDCGFNTPRTFYRQFREAYNMSPREYRKEVAA